MVIKWSKLLNVMIWGQLCCGTSPFVLNTIHFNFLKTVFFITALFPAVF